MSRPISVERVQRRIPVSLDSLLRKAAALREIDENTYMLEVVVPMVERDFEQSLQRLRLAASAR